MTFTLNKPQYQRSCGPLTKLRLKAGITQLQVAQRIGLNYFTYQNIEQGRSPLTEEVATKLAAIYHVPMPEILAKNGMVTERVRGYMKRVPELGVLCQLLAERPRTSRRWVQELVAVIEKHDGVTK